MRILKYMIILTSLVLSTAAYAAAPTDAIQMLRHIASQLQPWFFLVTAACYIMGALMVFGAIWRLKIYGQAMTMMSSSANLKEPLVVMCVGIAFLYMPTLINIAMESTFGSARILTYDELRGQPTNLMASLGLQSLLYIVQFIGLISFVRGLMIISKAAHQGSQQHTFGKGFTHIVAGIIGLNVIQSWNLLAATLGI